MGPPRPIVATLEGHHAAVKGRQDLLSSTKFLCHILVSTSETKLGTPSHFSCLSGDVILK